MTVLRCCWNFTWNVYIVPIGKVKRRYESGRAIAIGNEIRYVTFLLYVK